MSGRVAVAIAVVAAIQRRSLLNLVVMGLAKA